MPPPRDDHCRLRQMFAPLVLAPRFQQNAFPFIHVSFSVSAGAAIHDWRTMSLIAPRQQQPSDSPCLEGVSSRRQNKLPGANLRFALRSMFRVHLIPLVASDPRSPQIAQFGRSTTRLRRLRLSDLCHRIPGSVQLCVPPHRLTSPSPHGFSQCRRILGTILARAW